MEINFLKLVLNIISSDSMKFYWHFLNMKITLAILSGIQTIFRIQFNCRVIGGMWQVAYKWQDLREYSVFAVVFSGSVTPSENVAERWTS